MHGSKVMEGFGSYEQGFKTYTEADGRQRSCLRMRVMLCVEGILEIMQATEFWTN